MFWEDYVYNRILISFEPVIFITVFLVGVYIIKFLRNFLSRQIIHLDREYSAALILLSKIEVIYIIK